VSSRAVPPVDFDASTGSIEAPREWIDSVVDCSLGWGDDDRRSVVDADLGEAGAGTLADPHPRLADLLSPLSHPVVGLRVGRDGYAMPAWVGEGRFAIHVPRGPRSQLIGASAEHLTRFLTGLLEIGPRDHQADGAGVRSDGSYEERQHE
jgi:hypothetical protein